MNILPRAFAIAATLMLSAGFARADVLFPPATEDCYVGTDITPTGSKALPYSKPAVPVTTVRLVRAYPELSEEETQERPRDGRFINLMVNATFADAGKNGLPKRYSNGTYELLRCTDDLCDANNFKVERQPDGSVLLRMTGGMYLGGGPFSSDIERRLPDGHVYKLNASAMTACR
jgi:hypothetical protein